MKMIQKYWLIAIVVIAVAAYYMGKSTAKKLS